MKAGIWEASDMTTTTALTAFLERCLAEDEAVARKCAEAFPPPWDVSDRGHTATVRADAPNFWLVTALEQWDGQEGWLGDYVSHIAHNDPANVLRRVEAHRKILALHTFPEPWCSWTHDNNDTHEHGNPCPTLRALATTYADREGYDEAWRP